MTSPLLISKKTAVANFKWTMWFSRQQNCYETAVNIWKSYIWTADKDVNMKAIFAVIHIHVFIHSSNIWLSYIHSHLFTTSRVYLVPTQWPAPSWLVSSVGRALHWYCRGHGFKSRTGLNFFSGLFFTTA